MPEPTNDVEHLVELTFQSKLFEESPRTKQAADSLERDFVARGVLRSGKYWARLAELQIEGIGAVLEGALSSLEEASTRLDPVEFGDFWEKAKAALKMRLTSELRTRRLSLANTMAVRGENGAGIEVALGQYFGQHSSNLLARLGQRVEEIRMTRKFRREDGGKQVNISVSHSPGANVNTGDIGGSQTSNVVVSQAMRVLGEMRETLERGASLGADERSAALRNVQTVEAEIQQPKPNKATVMGALDALAKIAPIATAAAKLIELLGPVLLG